MSFPATLVNGFAAVINEIFDHRMKVDACSQPGDPCRMVSTRWISRLCRKSLLNGLQREYFRIFAGKCGLFSKLFAHFGR